MCVKCRLLILSGRRSVVETLLSNKELFFYVCFVSGNCFAQYSILKITYVIVSSKKYNIVFFYIETRHFPFVIIYLNPENTIKYNEYFSLVNAYILFYII